MLGSCYGRIGCTCALVVLGIVGMLPFAAAARAALPDGRSYELVSPVDKNGGDVMAETTRTRAGSDGSAVQLSSLAAFGDARGTGIGIDYIARRDATPGTQGWATHAITPVQEPLSSFDLLFFRFEPRYLETAPDLSKGVFMGKSAITPGAPNLADVNKLYLRDDLLSPGAGHYTLINDCLSPPAGPCASPLTGDPSWQPGIAGESADFGHVIFESLENLTLGATGSLPKLYEWDHGTVRLAGILPDDACGAPPCAAESSAAGRGAGANGLIGTYTPNTISEDGSKIVFTSPVNVDSLGTEESKLYLRTGGTSTVQINASERTDCAGDPSCGGNGTPDPAPDTPQAASFWAATPDGSTVYFTTVEALTDDDNGASDLYAYDTTLPASDPHNLTLLSHDDEPDGFGSGVLGVIGTSVDGSYVYFVADDQLIDGGSPDCSTSSANSSPCIFLWHDETLRQVARINGSIEQDLILGASPWRSSRKVGRVTPDGKHMTFISEGTPEEQPAYDHGSECQGTGGLIGFFDGNTPPCAEVYVYDATANGGSGTLQCASCNPTGVHVSATDAQYNFRVATAAHLTSYLNRPLSDDGRYVFFSTGERLVPEDTNGDVYDVYQFDTTTGKASLLSSGGSPFPSFFLDAGADGRDVFLRTRDQLTGWDTDKQADLYDVRVGGGFPDPPVPSPLCKGDGCREPAGGSAELPAPGTITFQRKGRAGTHAAVFAALALRPSQLRRWATSGVVALRVRVSDPGRVSARVRGHIGKRDRIVARSVKTVRRGGTVTLRLRLSHAARAGLADRGRLALTIVVAYSGGGGAQRAGVVLTEE